MLALSAAFRSMTVADPVSSSCSVALTSAVTLLKLVSVLLAVWVMVLDPFPTSLSWAARTVTVFAVA